MIIPNDHPVNLSNVQKYPGLKGLVVDFDKLYDK